ncbi:MAG: N-acetylmuramoyl-L-alanine amidase [Ilumatobacter sp.]|uniref:peptidoglycan recognition protein family protein n=3 Tax=Ilumatobacter sp. TaxID=1967498 RepID=UPI003296E1F4
MCELCLPPMTRRRALALAGAATAVALLGRPDPTAAARSFQTEFGVNVEPRATWAGDSRPYLGDPRTEDVRFLLVHHTAGPSEGDPIQLIREVHDFHTSSEKGWPDVAYNFFVEPGGRVFEGRTGSLQQAVEVSATGGNQGFAQLVCLLGDFTDRNPSDAQLASLNGTLAWLANRYGLDTSPGATATFTSRGSNKWPAGTQVTADIVSGHREMSSTACPGDTFHPYLKERVQAEVHALRGNPQAPAPQPSTATSVAPLPASTQAPPPAPTAPTTAARSTEVTAPDVSTTAPAPSSTVTLPASSSTTTTTTTTVPASTAPPTVAAGPVISPPAPRADESAVVAPRPVAAADARSSSNAAVWALGAGGVTVAVAAGVYVAIRGHGDDARAATPLAAPPDGGDSTG